MRHYLIIAAGLTFMLVAPVLAQINNGGGGGGGGATNATIVAPLGSSTSPSAAVSVTDTGTPITGQSLSAGGQGLTGWLSQIYAGVNSAATFASQYPATAVPITASATGTTGATTATLTNVNGHTTYICGYSIRANATANANVTDTVTGVISGTMSSALWVPANTLGLGVDEQIFTPCIPASAVSVSIAVVSGAPGTGGVVTVKAWGYSL